VAFAFAVSSVATAAASTAPSRNEAEPRHVVILNSTDPYLPAFVALDRGMREAMRSGHTAPVVFHAETLDMHRFPRAQFERDVATLLGKKCVGLNVDVVIALAPTALDFAQCHRAEIWPRAAVVFNSVPSALLAAQRLDPQTIGVPVQLEFEPTLDLALKLRPFTRRLAVVAGTAEPDIRNLSFARRALTRYAGRVEVRDLAGLTLSETLAAVRTLPADAVVLHLTAFRDGAGVPLVPRDVLTQLAAASPVPVFGVIETYLGDGIVAGSIASYGAQGRRTGELVVRELNGEDPAAIGVQTPVKPGCVADWRQLRRWRIDEDLLP
jgi:hypothetical protein